MRREHDRPAVGSLMPLSLPMWPPVFTIGAAREPAAPLSASPAPPRSRWMIVDDTVQREVSEAEYRAALGSCSRIEVTHFPREDVLTHFCYRARS